MARACRVGPTAAGQRAGRAARRTWPAAAMLLGVLLPGLLPGTATAVAAPAIPPPIAKAARDADSAVIRQLRTLEQTGRASPKRSAAEVGKLLEVAEVDTALRIDGLTVQGSLLAMAPDPDGAEAVARRLEALASGGQAGAARAAAGLVRARSAEMAGDFKRAGGLIDAAAAQLDPEATPLARLRVLAAQAHIRNSGSRLDEAIRLGHEVLALADALTLRWWQAEARNELAWSYYQARQLDQAWSLNQEAMALARLDGDPLTLAHVYTVQGILQDARGATAEERGSLQAALDHARQAGAKYEESLYLANLADYYLKRADYPTALRHASLALPLTRELKNLNGETVALANIGLAQIAMRDLAAGKRHLRESIDIDERRGSLTGMSDTYAEMGQYLERAGDAAAAIEALHQHRHLSDQILQREQQQAILESRERFESERRARELELLRRDGALKAEQLRTRDLEQALGWLLALAAALAVAVVLMLVWRVRQTNARLEDSNAQLKEQAEIDPLTRLANRRHFQAAMRRLAADGRFVGTVLLADLDHFKRINDRHGHAAGDAVLVEVARRLQAMLREDDLIVRWGGEEFLVVVSSPSPDAVQALAQRMLDGVGGEPIDHGQGQLTVTVSIGYATFPIEPVRLPVSWERAIDVVDTAMYLAKAHGRNRAYGVREMHARDAAHFEAIGRALEDAWHVGEVHLTRLDGPVLPASASRAAMALAEAA